jgi:hypothetical protein
MSLTGRGKTTERRRFTLEPARLSITLWAKEKLVSYFSHSPLLLDSSLHSMGIFHNFTTPLSIFIDDLSFQRCDKAQEY